MYGEVEGGNRVPDSAVSEARRISIVEFVQWPWLFLCHEFVVYDCYGCHRRLSVVNCVWEIPQVSPLLFLSALLTTNVDKSIHAIKVDLT